MDVVGGEGRLLAPHELAARRREYCADATAVQEVIHATRKGRSIRPQMTVLLGVLLALAGAVWLAQGLNLPFAPGSFMTASPVWVVIGAVTMLAGTLIAYRARRG